MTESRVNVSPLHVDPEEGVGSGEGPVEDMTPRLCNSLRMYLKMSVLNVMKVEKH